MRYIDSLNLKSDIECFILIEPGLGYLVPALREKFKTSKIIALHAGSFPPHEGVPALCGADCEAVQKFLEKEIPEIDAGRIRIIEWRPSMNYYGEDYVKLLSATVEFIKRLDAGSRTVEVFGRRWVRNFFRNLTNVQRAVLYSQMEIPVIVTGSGPSLETALPVIRNMQDSCLIIAASSSIMALSAGGVTADIVIATDGGPWALRHIYSYYRNASRKTAALAVNLCAALPSQCSSTPQLIINDGSFWQSIVLHELALPSVVIPQRGTVTAVAVELAMLLSRGNIYLAGMDLCVSDIRTHARPYAFDSIFFGGANRLTPFYSEAFTRSRAIQEGASMNIYAGWFKKELASWPKRIFLLGSGHKVFESALPPEKAALKNTDEYFKTVSAGEEPALFAKRAASALLAAMKNGEFAENLKQELTPLLFAGEKKTTEQELERAIIKIACL